jgi:SAM-dependent methyltransferase
VTSPTTSSDPWLDHWLPLIGERTAGLPILELGCGGGRDSEVLAAAGHRVVGVDLSSAAIAKARERVPSAEFHCQDVRAAFPVERAGVVLATLSLHYFPWDETVALVERIHRTLQPNGLLLCRLNSTNDHHYGASGHPAIDANYYLVDGEPKRFFDRAALDRLFGAGWQGISTKEGVIARYDHPKSVWEVIRERS